jgi:Tfp pilus assembly protein PilV
MKFASIGTPEALRLRSDDDGQAGFTLLEALVSLAVVLAFAGVLGPHLSQSRRIMADADGRVAAQVLLRSLLDGPFNRSSQADVARNGVTAGLRWRVSSEPIAASERSTWQAHRVMASVTWGADQTIAAETIRLRKAPGR